MEFSASAIREFSEAGIKVAREAGQLLLDRRRSGFAISNKGEINLVTEVDLAAEELIVSSILKAFPAHSILAEECHNTENDSGIKWIIDPLDGTTNYAHGYQDFSVSMGLEIDGEVEWGVVFDPNRNELFTATRGRGAQCNGETLHVSKIPTLGQSLLATGFPYDIWTSDINNLDNFRAFSLRAQGMRRSGSAALDLCHVAASRLDGFWELKLNPWDCAAGYLIVRESGGVVTNFVGRRGSIYEGAVVASNGLIHEEMLAVLKSVNQKE